MKGVREIRRRIRSIISIEEITSAMKLISSAKLKKWQPRFLHILNYSRYFNEAHDILIALYENENTGKIFFEGAEKSANKKLYVVLTSNKGLCGPFNNQLLRYLSSAIRELPNSDFYFIAVGNKGAKYIEKHYPGRLIDNYSNIWDALDYDKISNFSHALLNDYYNGKYREIYFVFNQFKNVMVQYPVIEKLLPMERVSTHPQHSLRDYIFEPDKKTVIKYLGEMVIMAKIVCYFITSVVSEHSARMTALHKATDNCHNLKHALTLELNKIRQATITKEIIEVVSGAQALE